MFLLDLKYNFLKFGVLHIESQYKIFVVKHCQIAKWTIIKSVSRNPPNTNFQLPNSKFN